MSKYTYTEVDGHHLKLSNLSKTLFATDGIVKAEIIEYALKVYSKMAYFSKNRPLTLIRFPDGIDAHRFYTRNKPSWTPEWMPTCEVPWDTENTHLLINGQASLVWLANLAALEVHIMGSRVGHIWQPDHFVIDLDPSSSFSFENLKDLAVDIKEYLEKYDLVSFVKTSGGKGLHIIIPTTVDLKYDEQVDAIKKLLKPFIQSRKYTTLKISKTARTDKVLLDIYRNHKGNTTVSPYSIRGKVGAPVSTPLNWDEMMDTDSPQAYTIRNYDLWKDKGKTWDTLFDWARPMPITGKITPVSPNSNLKKYTAKRDFDKTTEPTPSTDSAINNKYVIQLHDASNLHYDLRLGMDGVLKSWAIPKGLPLTKGVKRLAIQTEDHPAMYLTYEGDIPKEEYGGGTMWVADTGSFSIKEYKPGKKINFSLSGEHFNHSFKLYKMKGKQWLIELEEGDFKAMPIINGKHMLADVGGSSVPDSKDFLYEVKWDGIRVFITKRNNTVTIISRSGRDLSAQFPELTDPEDYEVEEVVLDGEIVVLDEIGRPIFPDVISRMHTIGTDSIKKVMSLKPAVFYAFDVLYFDGIHIPQQPVEKRKSYIPALMKTGKALRFSDSFTDGKMLYEAIKTKKMEGIIAKRKGSTYTLSKRSSNWLKYKVRQEIECHIIGYSKGKGDRAPYFGALHLAQYIEDKWLYRGKVGTGFDTDKMKFIKEKLDALRPSVKMISDHVEEESKTTWIEPQLVAQIQYASETKNQTLREPVFQKLIF